MKNYIKVKETYGGCYCPACGKRYDDNSLGKQMIYDISFIQQCENGNSRCQAFRLCWNCANDLKEKLEEVIK